MCGTDPEALSVNIIRWPIILCDLKPHEQALCLQEDALAEVAASLERKARFQARQQELRETRAAAAAKRAAERAEASAARAAAAGECSDGEWPWAALQDDGVSCAPMQECGTLHAEHLGGLGDAPLELWGRPLGHRSAPCKAPPNDLAFVSRRGGAAAALSAADAASALAQLHGISSAAGASALLQRPAALYQRTQSLPYQHRHAAAAAAMRRQRSVQLLQSGRLDGEALAPRHASHLRVMPHARHCNSSMNRSHNMLEAQQALVQPLPQHEPARKHAVAGNQPPVDTALALSGVRPPGSGRQWAPDLRQIGAQQLGAAGSLQPAAYSSQQVAQGALQAERTAMGEAQRGQQHGQAATRQSSSKHMAGMGVAPRVALVHGKAS